jgi:hypothetical protein
MENPAVITEKLTDRDGNVTITTIVNGGTLNKLKVDYGNIDFRKPSQRRRFVCDSAVTLNDDDCSVHAVNSAVSLNGGNASLTIIHK